MRDDLLSVVIPVKDEESVLPKLADALLPVLRALGPFEVVFVDDGSTDRTAELVLKLRAEEPAVKLVSLSRNFGQQAAMAAGLAHASGDAVICMDADLQDPPSVIPDMVAKWRDGFDVVIAVRAQRDEGLSKRLPAKLFYRVMRKTADIDITMDSGDFCLLDRKAADALRELPERNRWTRGLRNWIGFRQATVTFDRPARAAGETKYPTRRLAKLAIDALFSFSSAPLRLATWLGFVAALVGGVYLAIALWAKLVVGHVPSGQTAIIAFILLLGGAQLFVMGLLGLYVARIYDETKGRPLYVVGERHGLER